MNGRPKSSNDIDPCIKPYYMIRDDLSYVHNLILKNQRIVVLTVLCPEVKETLHTVTPALNAVNDVRETPYTGQG